VAGALLIQQLPGLPAPLLWLPLALGAVGLFRLGRPGLAGVSLGLCWAGGYAALGLADALTAQGRVQVLVEGRIATIPSPMDRGQRFDLGVQSGHVPQVSLGGADELQRVAARLEVELQRVPVVEGLAPARLEPETRGR